MALTKLQKKLEGSLKYCYKWGWKASVCRVEISEKYYGDTKKHPDFGIDFLTKKYRKWQENISYTLESALNDLYTFKSARAGLPANTVFIKTGAESDLFVLDLDMKDGSLKPAFDFLKQIGYEPMTDEFTVKTQSGGLQVYMKGVPDLWDLLGTRSHIFGSGSPVDCRGPGGLVFGPNSEVIKYIKDSDDIEIKKYCIADGVDLSKPPVLRQVHPSLISFFKVAKSSYDMNGEANASLCTKSFDNMSSKQKDVINGAIKKCTEAQQGFRSEECFSLLRLLIKFQLDVEAAYSLVKNVSKFSERDRKWFEEMWLKALPSVEFKPKIEREPAPTITRTAATSVLASQHFSAKSLLSMKYDDTPPIQLADPWLYNSGIIVICGSPGAGKTVTALDLCRAAITGGSCWCDTLIFQKACKVLYFHGDLSSSVFINNYLKRMGIPLNDDNFKPIILSSVLAHMNKGMLKGDDGHKFIDFNILDPVNRKLYVDLISEYRPDIVILDSMSSFSYADENDKSTMTQMLTGLKMISDEYKHLVIALHHPRKENNDGKRAKMPLTMDDVRGSSAIAAHCDMVVGISKVFDDETGMQLKGYGKVHVLKEGARGLECQQFDPYQYRISNDADSNIIINYMDQEEDIKMEYQRQYSDINFFTECFEYSKTVYYPTLVEYIRTKKNVMLRMALKYLYRYVNDKVLIEHKEGRKKFYELNREVTIFNPAEEA